MAKKSILTPNLTVCVFCGRRKQAIHHIYYGTALRKVSDKHGFIAPVCNACHNIDNDSIHLDPARKKDLFLKRLCQKRYEENHTREEFMKLIGRNYL